MLRILIRVFIFDNKIYKVRDHFCYNNSSQSTDKYADLPLEYLPPTRLLPLHQQQAALTLDAANAWYREKPLSKAKTLFLPPKVPTGAFLSPGWHLV
jgi:hypothetical protein